MLQAVILIYRKSNRHQSTQDRYQQMAKGKSAILRMAQLFPVSESFTALISVCVVQLPYVEFEPLLVAARGVSGHVRLILKGESGHQALCCQVHGASHSAAYCTILYA